MAAPRVPLATRARAILLLRERQNRPKAIDLTAVRRAEYESDYEAWARNLYRIRDKHDRIIPLTLRPSQRHVGTIEAEEMAAHGRARIFVLKGRQGGISTDQQARALWSIWREPHTNAMTLVDTRDRGDELFAITRRAINLFPPGFLPKRGPAHTREVSFPSMDSRFIVDTAGQAEKTAIGLTLSRLHGSEFSFWPEPSAALAAASPALERPGTTVVLETTASGYGTDAHEFWQRSLAGITGYRCVFIPWWLCDPELYRVALDPEEARDLMAHLTDDERPLVTRHGLDAEQIAWRRKKMGEYGRAEFLRQYAEDDTSCWLAPGGMYYDAETIKALRLRTVAPREVLMGGELEVYGDANGEDVIIGSDTGEGVGGDASTWVARAFPSWRRLARYRSNTVQPKEFARTLAEWGRKLGGAKPAFIVIEKNMHGITVLRHMRDDEHYKASCIYHRAALDQSHAEKGARIGWATTEESKPIMLSAGRELLQAALDGLADVPTDDVLTQAMAVRREDGKYDLNGKDDLVAEMLCWIGRSAPRGHGLFVA